MTVSLEQAATALRPELQEQVNFFADQDQRHFVDPTTLTVIGTALITLFLKSMVGEFGKTVGHELGTGVVAAVKQVLQGSKPSPAEQGQAVEAARATLAALPRAQFDALVASVRAGMSGQLAVVLPAAGAEALAAQVGKQAAAVVHG